MKKIFLSTRFWMIVIIAVLQILAVFNLLGGVQVDQLINIISVAIASIAAIRTIDRNTGDAVVEAAKVAGQMTTVSIPSDVSQVTATTSPQA